MRRILFAAIVSATLALNAQTDVDAIRLSRVGAGGTSRALAMGGAFGAVGADVSSAAYNPSGLALFRKGEFSFSGGLKFVNNSAEIYNTKTSLPDLRFVFNNFGLALAWDSSQDPESRHVLAFSSTQVQNFSNSVRMSGYTNNSSIARDMQNLASQQRSPSTLNYAYEGLGFEAFLLDTFNGQYISLLDTKRTVLQRRDLLQAGRQNDLNISYAYSYKDKYYIGASLGIPRVEYESAVSHTEFDDNDSMRIVFTSPDTYTHTFVDDFPGLNNYYANMGAFHSLEFIEYFKTTGTGYNLKLGGIARVNDMLRLGFYYHTPTIYRLTDIYFSQLSVYFDKDPGIEELASDPVDGTARFEYRLVTPSRIGINSAFIFNKAAVVSVDYEMINYRKAQFSSRSIDDFAGVNELIGDKYSAGHNVKVGAEINVNPLMFRAGYAMLGSPFGDAFTGDFVRHTFSLGAGIRPGSSFYIDLVWLTRLSSENYFLFTTLNTGSRINFNSSMLGATAGIRF